MVSFDFGGVDSDVVRGWDVDFVARSFTISVGAHEFSFIGGRIGSTLSIACCKKYKINLNVP